MRTQEDTSDDEGATETDNVTVVPQEPSCVEGDFDMEEMEELGNIVELSDSQLLSLFPDADYYIEANGMDVDER